jgi:hypothetical protein
MLPPICKDARGPMSPTRPGIPSAGSIDGSSSARGNACRPDPFLGPTHMGSGQRFGKGEQMKIVPVVFAVIFAVAPAIARPIYDRKSFARCVHDSMSKAAWGRLKSTSINTTTQPVPLRSVMKTVALGGTLGTSNCGIDRDNHGKENENENWTCGRRDPCGHALDARTCRFRHDLQ